MRKWQIAGVFIARGATKFIVSNDVQLNLIRCVMGLKKRSLSLVGRDKPCTDRYTWWELVACGTERYTKKGLGFFGHVTGQASGWCEGEAVEAKESTTATQNPA